MGVEVGSGGLLGQPVKNYWHPIQEGRGTPSHFMLWRPAIRITLIYHGVCGEKYWPRNIDP